MTRGIFYLENLRVPVSPRLLALALYPFSCNIMILMQASTGKWTNSTETLVIVGVGLLGASLGLAVRQRNLAGRVIGIGREGSPSVEIALRRGAITESATDLSQVAGDADMIVLCAPVRTILAALKSLKGKIKPKTVVTDVGSTKAAIMIAGQGALGGQFIGSHPMAGSEKRGPEAARADLYQGGLCILCGSSVSAEGQNIEAFWRAVGMRIKWLDPEVHDRCVAAISHLPHAAAASLVNTAGQSPEFLDIAATGFFDTTRVASGDVDMWVDILLTNRTAMAEQLAAFGKEIDTLRQAVIRGDESIIREHLVRAKQTRNAALAKRNKGIPFKD